MSSTIKLIIILFFVLPIKVYGGSVTAYDVLAKAGFNDKVGIFSDTTVGKITKNTNADVVSLLTLLKKAEPTSDFSRPVGCTILFFRGSSFESQKISISIGQSDTFKIEHSGKILGIFKHIEILKFCMSSHERSTIVLK